MALAPGTRLGAYEITGLIGAGGMGEVYRARDAKLKRDVAIKVLPADVANDRERLARFQREAEVLASLNHPHIAHVYGFENPPEGGHHLVMELVEGEDLADRIARGPIHINEALPIARQIAEALEAAHDAGIIHRDLKPANVKVRPDGTVKVLDFGLAKAFDTPGSGIREPGSGRDPANSPTITSPAMTAHGMILGTAAYMSPEQAKGKPVDKRADIWAFGCVLYETLTGRRAFQGEDATDTIAEVLKSSPDYSALPSGTPPMIQVLLRRCFEKDPHKRAPHIAVARLAIEDAMADAGELMSAPARAGSRARSRVVVPIVIGTLAVMLAAAAGYRAASQQITNQVAVPYRSTLLIQENLNARAPSNRLALSPDGRRLAYLGDGGGESRQRIWVRSLDGLASQPLPGSEGATGVFWSPDSRWLAFFAAGELRKIDAGGGPPITIAADAQPLGTEGGALTQGMPGSWNQDDVIIFSKQGTIVRVPARGGIPERITALDSATETQHEFPFFLPDGRHFIYAAYKGVTAAGTFVGSLDGSTRIRLLDDSSNAQFASGSLLFVRGTTVMVQAFDAERLALSGDAAPLVEGVLPNLTARNGAGYAVSQAGTLVYQPALNFGSARLAWTTRSGQQTILVDEPAVYRDLTVSPDGRNAALGILDERGRSDIWILNLARGVRSRLTTGAIGQVAVWSPDGEALIFSAVAATGATDLYRRRADGSDAGARLTSDDLSKSPTDWSRDGRTLLFDVFTATTSNDVMSLTLDGPAVAMPVFASRFSERWAQFSPDGRWIAYTSDESGTREVYLTTRDRTSRWQVSAAGGNYPRWSPDGRELYFFAPATNQIVAARIDSSGERLNIGALTPLFDARAPDGFARYFYDVAADGRFLMTVPVRAETTQLTMIVNWPSLLNTTTTTR